MDYDGENMPFTLWIKDGVEHNSDKLPDYLNDLNAISEAEKTLTLEKLYEYWSQLLSMTEYIEPWAACSSSALRSEAFLRVTGEWRDEP